MKVREVIDVRFRLVELLDLPTLSPSFLPGPVTLLPLPSPRCRLATAISGDPGPSRQSFRAVVEEAANRVMRYADELELN